MSAWRQRRPKMVISAWLKQHIISSVSAAKIGMARNGGGQAKINGAKGNIHQQRK